MKFALLPTNIAIVGSRSFASRTKTDEALRNIVESFVAKTSPMTRIVSGGAIGVDTYAIDAAEKLGRPWDVHLPSKTLPSPVRYFVRNSEIVKDMKEHLGIIVAFIDVDDYDGTKNTLTKAKVHGVETIVFKFTVKPFKYLGKDDQVFDEYITK